MTQPTYSAVLVGLTGIGAGRSKENTRIPVFGKMPRSHAEIYHHHPRIELRGICDLRQEILDQFRETWADVWPDIRTYTDYREMLEAEEPDIVSVATSDHAHADITVAAAMGSARAIFCEKPIATSLADADRMIAATTANDVLLSIDHTRRWDPMHLKVREIVLSGELGPLRTIHSELYSPRAMLFRNGTHSIDLINFFAGTQPQWVSAELEEGFEHFSEYQGDGGRDPATDPYASAYIRFAGGIRAFYNSYKTEFPGSQVTLTCEQGRIVVSDREAVLIRGSSHYEWSSTPIQCESYTCEGQMAAIVELVNVLENGGELISTAQEGRKTLEIILGILQSHQAGNTRVDFPLSQSHES